jgi:hypothetical protein
VGVNFEVNTSRSGRLLVTDRSVLIDLLP